MVVKCSDAVGEGSAGEGLVVLEKGFFGDVWRRDEYGGSRAQLEGHEGSMSMGETGE